MKNVLEKLFLDPFQKYKIPAYIWIDSLKFYAIRFYCMPS